MEYALNIALVILTGSLAWATVKLAKHTLTLSRVTESLVAIERTRDERVAKEKLISELRAGLAAAEKVVAIHLNDFATGFERADMFPEKDINQIETLQALSPHIEDSDYTRFA